MEFVSRFSVPFVRDAEPEPFECKTCGATYALDRQACPECDGFSIGYRDSWLERELDDVAATENTH
ncbi:hypothetical protein DMJ13_12570 [halophilic archaeon]|nr:hypothetical protein DMJ13_12570 [halophilic archaeon]